MIQADQERDGLKLRQAHDLAEGLAGMLRLARTLAACGRTVDLTELDRHVGLLCARALDLPPEQGRGFRPVLQGVLAEVDALAAALTVPPGAARRRAGGAPPDGAAG